MVSQALSSIILMWLSYLCCALSVCVCVCVCVSAISPVDIPVEEAQVSYIHLQQDSPARVTDLKSRAGGATLHLTRSLKCRPIISSNRVIKLLNNTQSDLILQPRRPFCTLINAGGGGGGGGGGEWGCKIVSWIFCLHVKHIQYIFYSILFYSILFYQNRIWSSHYSFHLSLSESALCWKKHILQSWDLKAHPNLSLAYRRHTSKCVHGCIWNCYITQ